MALKAAQVDKAPARDKTYKLFDEKGLYLQVTKTGAKYWRMKYRYAGKEKLLSIGVYPEVSLKAARLARDEARQQLSNGIDPSLEKQLKRSLVTTNTENNFGAIALEWAEVKLAGMSHSHVSRTTRNLQNHLIPALGKRPVTEITAPDLLRVLRVIESRGTIDTAHRCKQVAGQVFRYAVATGRADRDVSADLKGALKARQKNHYASITEPKEVGRLLLAIDEFQGTNLVKAALKLSPLLFCRQGELRQLEWSEVNWDESRIEIPAAKMKMREDLIIPLSHQAKDIIEQLQPLTGRGKYLFPSARGGSRPISDNTVRTALRTLGYTNEQMTPHGFRAMARTLLDEVLGYRVEWIEQQLAHTVKDTNGRAYNRTKHLPQRAEMMQRWADYLDELKLEASTPNVISPGFRRSWGNS